MTIPHLKIKRRLLYQLTNDHLSLTIRSYTPLLYCAYGKEIERLYRTVILLCPASLYNAHIGLEKLYNSNTEFRIFHATRF